jgi:hypothetical protein
MLGGTWVFTNMEKWVEIRHRVLVDGQSKRSVRLEIQIVRVHGPGTGGGDECLL